MWSVSNFMTLHDILYVFFLKRTASKEYGSFRGSGAGGGWMLVVILSSVLCIYDNLRLKLHQEKRSCPDEGWFFIRRFKVRNVPGVSVVRVASKKSIKISHESDARPLIQSYNCY